MPVASVTAAPPSAPQPESGHWSTDARPYQYTPDESTATAPAAVLASTVGALVQPVAGQVATPSGGMTPASVVTMHCAEVQYTLLAYTAMSPGLYATASVVGVWLQPPRAHSRTPPAGAPSIQ